jgi:hypothetical protein
MIGIIYFVVQTFGKFKTFQKLCENRSILSHFYNLYHKVDNSVNDFKVCCFTHIFSNKKWTMRLFSLSIFYC